MSQMVRVHIGEPSTSLAWPKRCPRCGTDKSLTQSVSRVGRVKSMRPDLLGGLTMKSDVMYFSYPMCKQHAAANMWANRILEKGPLMYLMRTLAYVGSIFALVVVIKLGSGPDAVARVADLGAFLGLALFGVAGVAAIIWARRTTSVWPVRFDPDMDVVEFRFADDGYAREFVRSNARLTDADLTHTPPWYRRSLLWKVLLIVGFLIFAHHMTRP